MSSSSSEVTSPGQLSAHDSPNQLLKTVAFEPTECHAILEAQNEDDPDDSMRFPAKTEQAKPLEVHKIDKLY